MDWSERRVVIYRALLLIFIPASLLLAMAYNVSVDANPPVRSDLLGDAVRLKNIPTALASQPALAGESILRIMLDEDSKIMVITASATKAHKVTMALRENRWVIVSHEALFPFDWSYWVGYSAIDRKVRPAGVASLQEIEAIYAVVKRNNPTRDQVLDLVFIDTTHVDVDIGEVRGPLDGGGHILHLELVDEEWKLVDTTYWVS